MLLQSIGIIGSLLLATASFRSDSKDRRVSNLIGITNNHRKIWTQLRDQPALTRILEENPDLENRPVSRDEEQFVLFLILHLNASYHAIKDRMLIPPEQLGEDIRSFFTLPIPRSVWKKTRAYHNQEFMEFVESYIL